MGLRRTTRAVAAGGRRCAGAHQEGSTDGPQKPGCPDQAGVRLPHFP